MSSRDQSIPTTFGVIKIFRNADGSQPPKEASDAEKTNKRRSKRVSAFQTSDQTFQQQNEIERTEPVRSDVVINDESSNLDFFGLEKADSVAREPKPVREEEPALRSAKQDFMEADESLFGSIAELKEKKAAPKTTSAAVEIPLVASRKLVYDEENPGGPRLSARRVDDDATSKTAANKKLSNHKLLAQEVPQWFNKTQDEATDLLFKRICYFNEEEGLFALDKPYGLPSIGGPGVTMSVASLLPLLEKRLKLTSRLLMAHRLDEYTTGVMLFAMNVETMHKVREYFNERKIVKQYLAITKNAPTEKDGEIDIPLIRRDVGGITKTYLSPNYDKDSRLVLDKPKKQSEERVSAITRFRVLDNNNDAAFLDVQPLTGFQHQIRAHLAFGLGCPILGDHKYSHYSKMAPQRLPNQMLKCLKISQTKVRHVPMHLHASKLILPEFHKNANVFISAKLPLHFLNNLKRLKLRF